MAELNDRFNRWMLRHWPYGVVLVYLASLSGYSLISLLLRSDDQPAAGAVVQAAILAIGTTWAASQGVRRARKAAGEVAEDEDVVAVMSYVDRLQGDLDPGQRPMAQRFAKRELASVDRSAVILRTAVVTVLVAVVAALLGGPIAALVIGTVTAVVAYGVIEAFSVRRRLVLEEVLTTLGAE